MRLALNQVRAIDSYIRCTYYVSLISLIYMSPLLYYITKLGFQNQQAEILSQALNQILSGLKQSLSQKMITKDQQVYYKERYR